ncbi:hypothetical protein SAMN02745225_01332 [Ferrithrix thermotolerans DSM 19514]|uniref:Uncharacterized protein n=1 Tax=Ferrithrix thermotolerans DSM 19514 TaxID=1121881 RepID=A0A1M4VHM7_9ACTN|nr:hypothetical protein SAMN02745225_01332 [Ferrithrix thermotolerans DSM 19514]
MEKTLSELPRFCSVSVMLIYLGLKIQLMRAKRHPFEFTSSVEVNDRGALSVMAKRTLREVPW